MTIPVALLAACLTASGWLPQEGDEPFVDSTCKNEDTGEIDCRPECTCNPVAGPRIHGQSPRIDHNRIDIAYYVPGTKFQMGELKQLKVAKAFHSNPSNFWTEGGVADALHSIRERLSSQMHYVFNVVEAERKPEQNPDPSGDKEKGHRVTYTVIV